MMRQAALHRLGPWLLGLFIVAQICGVVHLLGEHTTHVAESQSILSSAAVARKAPHGHHHDGDTDGAIQHHELQDLTGAPVYPTAVRELDCTRVAMVSIVSAPLVEGDPLRLERPPKRFLPA
jgi:hypothetical protein